MPGSSTWRSSGLAHASPAGAAHALDDGRERHREQLARRWVRRLVDETERFVQREQPTRLLLVAEPRLLGGLRDERRYERLRGTEVIQLGENLTQRPVAQIHSILALRAPYRRLPHPIWACSARVASPRWTLEARKDNRPC